MSYDVDLLDPTTKRPVCVDRHSEGGTYQLGGTTEASLNITYNYAMYYYQLWGGNGLKTLNGMEAKLAIPLIIYAVRQLGTERDPDYWKATVGNAGYALNILLKWAEQHPNAVFKVC